MFGLLIVAAFGIYLTLLVGATWWGYRWARRNKQFGRHAWVGGLIGFLVVYLPVFWDHIPTLIAHKSYCQNESGFWVYKTLDQWRQENPGMAGTLVPSTGASSMRQGDMDNYTDTYVLNERFIWVVRHNGQLPFNRWRHEQELVDRDRGEILARYIDFSTSQLRRQAGWSGWKMWLDVRHCSNGRVNESKMGQFILQAKNIGQGNEK